MSQKNRNKIILKKKGENDGEKKQFDKRRKDNKTLSQKIEKGQEFFLSKDNKKEGTED
jgi:hypothetical protein